MESEEFQIRYGETSNEGFVDLLFRNVLDRAPAQSGLSAWTALLDGGMTREALVTEFMNTPEFVIRTAGELRRFMLSFGQDDNITAASTHAVLSGGMFADNFFFISPESDEGMLDGLVTSDQVVTDFEAWDAVLFADFGYASVGEALGEFEQDGDDVVFDDQGMTITFLDTTLDMFDINSVAIA